MRLTAMLEADPVLVVPWRSAGTSESADRFWCKSSKSSAGLLMPPGNRHPIPTVAKGRKFCRLGSRRRKLFCSGLVSAQGTARNPTVRRAATAARRLLICSVPLLSLPPI